MGATNQQFSAYQDDDVAPIFTVKDAAGNPVDISTVSEIEFIAYLDAGASPLLKKLKSTGGIVFVTNGTNGQLKVLIDKTDTSALAWGWYWISVIITDSTGEISTVATGRFAILERGKRT